MRLKKLAGLKLPFLFIVTLGLIVYGIFGIWRYQQSSVMKQQADLFIKEGRPEEAIILYHQAHVLFPFRQDVVQDEAGANLILESDLDYGRIYQIGGEIQTPPPLSQLPAAQALQPNELFVPILMYHHIRLNPRPADPVWAALNVSPDQLDSQLQYLISHNYHAITLDELYQALNSQVSLPVNPVILTFDDGYSSFYDHVFPLLKKYHLKAVEFVITQVVGTPPYLSWDQILEIDKSGLVEWGAHTQHHPNLFNLSKPFIVSEIKGSKEDLEQHLQKPITWFAYPYGSYNDFIVETVRKAGFVGAASTIYGAVQNKDKIYLVPRIMVDGRFSLTNFAARLQK